MVAWVVHDFIEDPGLACFVHFAQELRQSNLLELLPAQADRPGRLLIERPRVSVADEGEHHDCEVGEEDE